jgi:hypothetical protein
MHFSKQPYLIHISLAQIYNKKSIGSIPLNQSYITLPKKQLNPKKHGSNQPHQPTAHHPLLRLYLRQYFWRVAEIKKLIINRREKLCGLVFYYGLYFFLFSCPNLQYSSSR